MTVLEWLCIWYGSQADGDWEHEHGVAIESLDNPGWSVRIDLVGTDCDGRAFEPRKSDQGDRWWRCWKDDATNVFHGASDPLSLGEVLECFRGWVTAE